MTPDPLPPAGGDAIDWAADFHVLALRNRAFFPGVTADVDLIRKSSVASVEALPLERAPLLVVVAQRGSGSEDDPAVDELPRVGVLVRLKAKIGDDERGRLVTLEGVTRVALERIEPRGGGLVARIAPAREIVGDRAALSAREAELKRRALALLSALPAGERAEIERAREPGAAADRIAAALEMAPLARAELMTLLDVDERLQRLERLLGAEEARQAEIGAMLARTAREPVDLWVIGEQGTPRIARSRADGTVSAQDAADLEAFARDGFVIWTALIAPTDVDALVSDVAQMHRSPGRFLTTDHKRSRAFRLNGREPDAFESIFDAYVNLESSRSLCFHPRIVRFLRLLFDARPVATQQLLFQRSNGHEAHQDTAFVCMEEPLQMVATWIALEDVVAGRGELMYYEGSHRIPGCRFADGSKRFTPGADDAIVMRDELLAQCRTRGCAKRAFLAKKGDVFLWSADLVHGSNPRTRPIEETRLSCVTHYCPETTRPLWMLNDPDHRALQPYGEHAAYASSHYRLPTSGEAAVPDFRQPLSS